MRRLPRKLEVERGERGDQDGVPASGEVAPIGSVRGFRGATCCSTPGDAATRLISARAVAHEQ
jgi:hypothetical protein